MMDLSKDALALLESARRADAAPLASRQRVRRRLIHAIAASAAVAEGATLSVLGSTKAGAAAGAGASITSGPLGAVVTGLALGMVAITPASKRMDEPFEQSPAAVVATARAPAKPQHESLAPASPTAPTQPEAVAETPAPSAFVPVSMPSAAEASILRNQGDSVPSTASNQSLGEQQVAATNAAPALASVALLPPSKASEDARTARRAVSRSCRSGAF